MRHYLGVGLGLALALLPASEAQRLGAQDPTVAAAPAEPWSREELENLLAPIALYPDPILAQVLIAATYPDQVQAAADYVRRYGTEGLDSQPWEISVKAVAHYAPVLNLMAEGEEWTVALGQAYAEQPRDVMDAVQNLRRMANAQGNLVSTEQQQVVVEREVIRIVPAQPRVVYVPTYDPAVVYFRPIHVVHAHPAYWSFGVAFPIGVWLTYDFDWWGHRVYYHGWHARGPHWVVVSRPWVAFTPIYVAPRHTTIVINRTIVNRRFDPRPLRRYTVVHKHTTFDRRGVPRRDVGRNDRGEWDRGRNDDRREWTRGRGDDNRGRGNDDGGRRVAPVPMGGKRVADGSRGTAERSRGTFDAPATSGRRVTPIAGGTRPSRNTADRADRSLATPVPLPTRAAAERGGTVAPRATPLAVPTTRSSGGLAGTPTRAARAPQALPRASVPESARRTRDARPSTAGTAAPRGSESRARGAPPSRGSSESRGAVNTRSAGASGRSASPARGSGSAGRSASPARGGGGGGGGSKATRSSGRRGNE